MVNRPETVAPWERQSPDWPFESHNVETIAAIQAVERGEFTTHDSTTDLYRTLDI